MKRICFVISAFSFSMAVFFSVQTTAAQLVPSVAPKGLSISPIRTEFDAKPGTTYEGALRIANNTNTALPVSLNAEAFSIASAAYDYSFDKTSNLVHWVTFTPNQLTLAPGSFQTVHYTVAVPLGAEPHGEYISLFASVHHQALIDSSVAVNERVASLLYVTVDGAVSRKGELLSMQNPWLTTKVLDWTAHIRNKGTTHFRSLYTVTTSTLFGGQVAAPYTGSALVLPGTIRTINGTVPLPQFPGIYKITYKVGLGDTPAAMVTRYFLYAPLVPSVFIIACLLIIGSFFPVRKMRFNKKSH